MTNRRNFLKSVPLVASAAILAQPAMITSLYGAEMTVNEKGEYLLPPLRYEYNALEPHIDEQTMRLHHDKHHLAYVNGLNDALAKLQQARESGDVSLVQNYSGKLAFHGSGHLLHVIFWENMSPKGGGEPKGALAKAMNSAFGSFEKFVTQFSAAANQVEGSGWAILAFEPLGKKLVILQAEKHQNLTQWGVIPLLALDVWEHAYYLKYQNRRGDYVKAFFNVINWEDVAKRYQTALKLR